MGHRNSVKDVKVENGQVNQSRTDFVAGYSVACKEASEINFRLRLLAACVFLLLLVPTIGYAGDTCDIIGTEFYNDIKLGLKYEIYSPEIKACAEVEVMNMSAGNRLTVYITAHFKDGSHQKEGFSGGYVEKGETRKHKMCWSKDSELAVFTCEF